MKQNDEPKIQFLSEIEYTDSEALVNEVLKQLSLGNNRDATYHPLYKAWRSLCNNPEQLKQIQNFEIFGCGFIFFYLMKPLKTLMSTSN